MFESNARGVLLDIEGTTSSISFVYDVMFPYFREHVESYLATAWGEEAVVDCLPVLAADFGKDSVDDWMGHIPIEQRPAFVVASVIGLMDDDVKATGLKQLQGLVWKDGFHQGQMVAHLFDDVADVIRQWKNSEIDIRIYSSGSIQAQKLFFGHCVAGDLLDQFGGHYDTTTGPKKDAASYERIAAEFDCAPAEILFVSDVVAELEAARTAGMQTVLSIRPGNHPVEPGHSFESVESFEEIRLG